MYFTYILLVFITKNKLNQIKNVKIEVSDNANENLHSLEIEYRFLDFRASKPKV